MLVILLILGLAQPPTVPGRRYHHVPLEQMVTTSRTHVEVCGPVVYRRKMRDGDWHLSLDNGKARIVVEIIPAIPLDPPRKGQTVRVRGISRFDRFHRWHEIHPAEQLWVVRTC